MRDKHVKKGSMLSISPWLIQRSRDQWQDPNLFDPDRFDDEAQQTSVKESYLPFGRGPRICIGKGFATQEAISTIAHIVKNFSLRNKDGQKPEPVARVTTRPSKEIELWFEEF